MAYHDYFPIEIQELRRELQNHPALLVQLMQCNSFEESFGEIAAYLGMVLDGVYGEEDLRKLADIMIQKLKEKNSVIVVH